MMSNISFRHILVSFFIIVMSTHLGAQSIDGARKQMSQGNYSNAITILTALQEIYPGQYEEDLRIAQKCQSLQYSARLKLKSGDYQEAETLRLLFSPSFLATHESSNYKPSNDTSRRLWYRIGF